MVSGPAQDRSNLAIIAKLRSALLCGLLAGLTAAVFADRVAAQDQAQPAEAAEVPADKEAPAKPPAQARPAPGGGLLNNLLKGMLRPNPRGGRAPDQAGDPATAEQPGSLDPVDSRAARDARNENMLKMAEQSVRRNDYKAGIEFLQRLLDEPGDSLHRAGRDRWQSLRQTAQETLGRMPAEGRALYREQYEGLARQEWDAARQQGDAQAVARVADRFLHTAAGQEAADWLGALHADRGEFGLADHWYQQLQRDNAPVTRSAAWKWKAAFVARQSGRSAESAPWPMELPPGRTGDRYARLKDLAPAAEFTATPQSDWRQNYGSERRLGVSAAGDPLLIPRWENPLTDSPAVARRIEHLQLDLRDQGLAPILAWQPLATHGVALFRGLRGVRAVDIATGSTLWETEATMTPEGMIAGLPPAGVDPQQAWRFRMNNLQQDGEYAGPSAEYHPVASLLFRDGVYGSISSDGEHVFLLEDQAVLSRSQPGWQWGEQENQDLYGLDWTSNRLSAYDLRSGRLRWTVGGSAADESLQLPLSDVCFLGSPAVDGDELFAIGARGDEVRLWCLETISGRLLWSQLLCYQDAKIDKDIGRRWLMLQPSLAEGLVVCPTALGWLVAIDRLRHSVLWAQRYAEPDASESRENGGNLVPQRSLAATWGPSAPVIAGRSIVYTAPEEPLLHCSDLLTGEVQWRVPQDDMLYLAGVFEKRVLLVGSHQIKAVNLTDGADLWLQPLELDNNGKSFRRSQVDEPAGSLNPDPAHADEAVDRSSTSPAPAGRGLAVPGEYYLPLTTGELRVIKLDDGATQRRFFTGPSAFPLGNLVWHDGTLVSLSSAGATGFGLRSGVLAEVQQRLEKNPRDSWALLREGEMLAMSRNFAEAWQKLKDVELEGLSSADRQRWRGLGLETLEQLVRQDPRQAEPWLAELRTLAATESNRSLLAELEVTRLQAIGNSVEAFERAWHDAERDGSRVPRTRTENRKIEVQPGAWHRGRLQDLWESSVESERTKIDEFVAELLKDLPERDPAAQQAMRRLLAFHPAIVEITLHHAVELSDQGHLAGAELELLPVIDLSPRNSSARCLLELAQRCAAAGRIDDARLLARRLTSRFGPELLPDGRTVASVAETIAPTAAAEPPRPGEKPAALKVEQGMVEFSTPEQEIPTDSAWPSLQSLDLVIQTGERRLVVSERQTGRRLWLAPLRSGPHEQGDGYITTAYCGSTLYLVHQGILHAIAPLEQRVLWTQPVSPEQADAGHWRTAEREPLSPLVRAEELRGYGSPVLGRGLRSGSLAAVTAHYVAVASRRTLRVLSPETGEELWQYHGLSPEDVVLPLASRLVVMDLDGGINAVLRACDGRPLDWDDVTDDLAERAIAVQGDAVLVSSSRQKPGLFSFLTSTTTTLQLRDAITGADRWSCKFDGPGLLGLLSPDEAVFAQSSGKLQLVDVATGAMRTFEAGVKFSLMEASEVHALADGERLYLLINSGDGRRFDHYSESVPSVEMHGVVVCWDRASGKLLWKRDVKKQHLVVEHFRSSPVLMFVARSWVTKENLNYTLLNLLAVDKATGDIVHQSSLPTMFNGFHSMKVLPQGRSVELRSYNYRIRLVPDAGADADAAAVQAVAAPPQP